MLRIGIVGCSAPGAALCYQTIISEGIRELGHHRHPAVTLHTPSLSDYMDHLEDGSEDWEKAAQPISESIDVLRMAGAHFAVCPDNTIHEGIDLIRAGFSLPYLHIAEVVAEQARLRGMQRLLILGTRYTAASSYYGRALSGHGIEHVMPDEDEVAELDRIIWEELYWHKLEPGSRRYYQLVIERHAREGCDGVVLGCTEIPLLITEDDSVLPTLDSTRLLAKAAVRFAIDDPLGLEAQEIRA
jgi:aspartate racemase